MQYDLCDIWRVRNTKSRRFTFAQKHSSGFTQRRLDYMFSLNTLQEFVTITEILTSISAFSREKKTVLELGI